MPIYEYRCSSCGFQKDHLQKVSDPRLTVCPQCAQATYEKRLTAAGFQLKGSGWYATDFKGGAAPAEAKKDGDAKEGGAKDGGAKEGGAKEGGADKAATPATEKAKSESAAVSGRPSGTASTPSSTPASTGAATP